MATRELLAPTRRAASPARSGRAPADVRDLGLNGGLRPLDAAPTRAAVSAGRDVAWLFLCGQTPEAIDATEPANSRARFGDMETQARGVLKQLQDRLQDAGFELRDVVKVTTYLVGDRGFDREVDLEGFERAWRDAFPFSGTPAHSRVQVSQLLNPGWRVELEVLAARETEREHLYRQPSKSLRPSSVLCLDQG